jgi:hypothetical protein
MATQVVAHENRRKSYARNWIAEVFSRAPAVNMLLGAAVVGATRWADPRSGLGGDESGVQSDGER